MTLKEVCEKYSVAESSVKNAFPRTQAAIIKKYNVRIEKQGRGKNAIYIEVVPDNRAVSMYEETKDIVIMDRSSLTLLSIDFCCFLGIILTPMMVFRGSHKDFLKYLEGAEDDKTM